MTPAHSNGRMEGKMMRQLLTPAMQAQIDQCRRMLAEGANPQDMRDLGYAQAAINAAINAEK
ncbi:hypothetical protein A3764_14265 [Sulfitobacter sp. HI0129]|jgi:hypothetical protein|nr:hypothetical protein A3721_15110 [Sulfitobacter sp. HI0023]KZZ67768.1 hypothetical protein A3764_14265 [Sulfitobacter sp. HI0129]